MPDLDSRARRLARKAGLLAQKHRWRRGTVDNCGGFMLIDPLTNTIVAGVRCDMSAADVIDYCSDATVSC